MSDPGDPQKLLVCGDWHGDTSWAYRMIDLAESEDCDGILQLGDFGYFPGDRFLHKLQRQLNRRGVDVWWVDGNHEHHDKLDAAAIIARNPDTGFVDITENIHHIPRAHRWVWSGVRFLGIGGAHTVDRIGRVPGKSWWPQETITETQADAAMAGAPVDVMVCHDAPSGFNPFDGYDNPKADLGTDINRQLLRRIATAARPTVIFCGHWHHRTSARLTFSNGWTSQVEVLDRNGSTGNWEVVELKPYRQQED